jgi:hypothetical protein
VTSKIPKKVVGAWILHHDQKLSAVRSTDFQDIALAGKASRLLSTISKEAEWSVSADRVQALAKANDIRKHEIPGLLAELEKQGLVATGDAGVAVLGVSQSSLLSHASTIFDAQDPSGFEKAAIDLAERASHAPVTRKESQEEIQDTYKLSSTEIEDLFALSEKIGFVDYEQAGQERLYFNGTLFRRDNAAKARIILEGLTAEEQTKLTLAEAELNRSGCVSLQSMQKILGPLLWSKLHQIGFFEVSVVANERGQTPFVMKPAALTKFVPGGLADMLDDAKALSSSLMYGIQKSEHARGRIRDPSLLMGALIGRGFVEGPVAAIRQDYQILERRGVVQVTSTSRGNRLTLLKPEVGTMAKELILRGDAAGTAMEIVAGQRTPTFVGPERSRHAERLKNIPEAKSGASRALDVLRKSR